MRRSHRGVTLIEVLVVIAIIGVLSTLAGVGAVQVNRQGRVNGMATAIAQVMASVRSRAMNERCRYVLQINGTDYERMTGPLRMWPNGMLVFRKGRCNSTVVAYEPGLVAPNQDRLIEQFALGEFQSEVALPPGFVPGDRLNNSALVLSWNELGQLAVAADGDADGVFDGIGLGAALTVTVRASPATDINLPSRDVVIPLAGRASAR